MPPRRKKLAAVVKVQLPAGQATPAPPVGTALGPHGVNIMDFVKQYNAATESQRGNIIPVEISIFEDRSFTFITKTPPAAELIKKAASVDKGSAEPHKTKVGSITAAQVRGIAQTKMPDLNATTIEAAEKIIAGTARSMGIKVGRCPFHPPAVNHRQWQGLARPADHDLQTWEIAMKRSKSYRQADEQIDHERLYTPAEAVTIAKAGQVTKFDPSVEVALRLGVDPRKQDQMVRGTVNLPNGTGKTARVLVFATGDRAEEARAAGGGPLLRGRRHHEGAPRGGPPLFAGGAPAPRSEEHASELQSPMYLVCLP